MRYRHNRSVLTYNLLSNRPNTRIWVARGLAIVKLQPLPNLSNIGNPMRVSDAALVSIGNKNHQRRQKTSCCNNQQKLHKPETFLASIINHLFWFQSIYSGTISLRFTIQTKTQSIVQPPV